MGASNSTSGPPAVSGTGEFLEVTLEESMRHRQELADENRALKTLLLRVSNDIQNVEFQARCAIADLLTVKEKEAGKLQDVEEVRRISFYASLLVLRSRNSRFVIARTPDPCQSIPPVPSTADHGFCCHQLPSRLST